MGARSEQGHARFHAGLLRKGGQVTKPDLGLAGDGGRGGVVDWWTGGLWTLSFSTPSNGGRGPTSQSASQMSQPAKVAST